MASTTARGKYPEQLIAMVSTETKDFIRQEAAGSNRSISEVARDYLETGIEASKPPFDSVIGGGEGVQYETVPLEGPVGEGVAYEIVKTEVGDVTRKVRTFY